WARLDAIRSDSLGSRKSLGRDLEWTRSAPGRSRAVLAGLGAQLRYRTASRTRVAPGTVRAATAFRLVRWMAGTTRTRGRCRVGTRRPGSAVSDRGSPSGDLRETDRAMARTPCQYPAAATRRGGRVRRHH